MSESDFQLPTFGFEWQQYLWRPWKLRWRLMPLPLYYGREFRENRAFVTQSLHWSKDDLERYQWDRLCKLIDHAYSTVPHYREVFETLKIEPRDITSFSDFAKLPTTNRRLIQQNPDSFNSSEFKRFRTLESTTSGTTDSPLRFYRTQEQEQMRRAVAWRHFNLGGYQFKQPMVSLSNVFHGQETRLLYKYDPLNNNLTLNCRMVSREQIVEMHRTVRSFKPVIFHGHPNAFATFAQLVKLYGLPSLNVKGVFTYSEVLSSAQTKIISEVLSANIFDYYANRENSISAAQLSCGSYHINSEFVYMELADYRSLPTGESYHRVVGTNLHNFAMPLIRYDADDLGNEIGPCAKCQLPHPTIKFVGGREKNFLVSAKGILNCKFDDTLHDLDYTRVREVQIEQIDLEKIVARVVPSESYDRTRDEEFIRKILTETTKGWFKIEIEYVDQILPTKGFKKSKVISRLGARYIEGNAFGGGAAGVENIP